MGPAKLFLLTFICSIIPGIPYYLLLSNDFAWVNSGTVAQALGSTGYLLFCLLVAWIIARCHQSDYDLISYVLAGCTIVLLACGFSYWLSATSLTIRILAVIGSFVVSPFVSLGMFNIIVHLFNLDTHNTNANQLSNYEPSKTKNKAKSQEYRLGDEKGVKDGQVDL